MVERDSNPPFSSEVHLLTPIPDDESKSRKIFLMRESLSVNHTVFYEEFKDWLTDDQLVRFLIARNYDLKKSTDMIVEAMKWRSRRRPHALENATGVGSTNEHWSVKFSKESETGKIYNPGFDKWGRPVLVFDNTVQNTPNVDDHMIFLAWNLEFAIRQMKAADKYTIFVHLSQFSFFNCPSWKSTTETLQMLCNCYPERLGHCIAFNPPRIFETFYRSVKGFMDPKTVGKILFIYGDISDGSPNDLKMKEVIGDNWKVLTGADQPIYQPKSSPGYRHDVYWQSVMQRINQLQKPDIESPPKDCTDSSHSNDSKDS